MGNGLSKLLLELGFLRKGENEQQVHAADRCLEMRIVMVGLDAAGKTTILYAPRTPNFENANQKVQDQVG